MGAAARVGRAVLPGLEESVVLEVMVVEEVVQLPDRRRAVAMGATELLELTARSLEREVLVETVEPEVSRAPAAMRREVGFMAARLRR